MSGFSASLFGVEKDRVLMSMRDRDVLKVMSLVLAGDPFLEPDLSVACPGPIGSAWRASDARATAGRNIQLLREAGHHLGDLVLFAVLADPVVERTQFTPIHSAACLGG